MILIVISELTHQETRVTCKQKLYEVFLPHGVFPSLSRDNLGKQTRDNMQYA